MNFVKLEFQTLNYVENIEYPMRVKQQGYLVEGIETPGNIEIGVHEDHLGWVTTLLGTGKKGLKMPQKTREAAVKVTLKRLNALKPKQLEKAIKRAQHQFRSAKLWRD